MYIVSGITIAHQDNNSRLQGKKRRTKCRVLHTVHVPVDVLESSKAFVCNFPYPFIICGVTLFLRPSFRAPSYPFLKLLDLHSAHTVYPRISCPVEWPRHNYFQSTP